jgi:phosphotransferase system HPr (HPr) family protein
MVERRITIRHEVGLHARPAALFVKTAQRFASSILIQNLTRGHEPAVDAKSILGVLALGVAQGHEVQVSANGPDEVDALHSLMELIETNFAQPEGA